MVFAADGLFHERFLEYLAIDNDSIAVFAQCHLRGDLEASQGDTYALLHEGPQVFVDFWPSVSRHLEAAGCRHAKMVENRADQPSIPQQSLRGQVVDAVWLPEFYVGDRLVKREISREE